MRMEKNIEMLCSEFCINTGAVTVLGYRLELSTPDVNTMGMAWVLGEFQFIFNLGRRRLGAFEDMKVTSLRCDLT